MFICVDSMYMCVYICGVSRTWVATFVCSCVWAPVYGVFPYVGNYADFHGNALNVLM